MKNLILTVIMLILTCGCRLEKLHDDGPDMQDLCPPFDIIGIDDYQPNGYEAADIIEINNNQYVICGSNTNNGNTFLMKVDEAGDTILFQSQDYQNSGTAYTASSVVQLKDGSGGYLICGHIGDDINQKAFFAKCDANGHFEEHTISSELGTHCEYITHANGNYVFAGYKIVSMTKEDIYIGKIDIDAMKLTTYPGSISHKQRAYAVQESGSGYLFAGYNLRNEDADPYVFRTDEDFNNIELCPPYSNTQGIDEIYITAMTTTSSGGYMFAGFLKKGSGINAPINGFMLEMDANCNYANRGIDIIDSDGDNVEIYSIVEVDDGRNYLMCGNRTGNSRYAYGLKLNAAGEILNDYSYDGNTVSISERMAAVAVGGDCNYMMAGYTEDNKILVVKMK